MSTGEQRPDLDSRDNIECFVDCFYEHLLADKQLAPIFVVAGLVGRDRRMYQRHTMNIHRQLHGKRPLQAGDFQRWLAFFTATVDAHYAGERAERAKQVAASIAANMEHSLPN